MTDDHEHETDTGAGAGLDKLTTDQRTADIRMTIDPGFVNHRLVHTVIGQDFADWITQKISEFPASTPDWVLKTQVNHLYAIAVTAYCEAGGVPSLLELLAAGEGDMFCAVVKGAPTPDLGTSDATRVTTRLITPGVDDVQVEVRYSPEHISATTTRMQLREGDVHAIVAARAHREGDILWFEPLIMGGPWLAPTDRDLLPGYEWWGYSYFELFAEDIDELAAVKGRALPADFDVLRDISEEAFKICLGEILGDAVGKDWGGETSDHYGAHLHVNTKPTTGAWLLKGPAKFGPMKLNTLGKNNDQIYRLAQEPAQLLIVQHCHDITPAVRATLRAFAVQPGGRRRYCLIDGRESLRILQAYDKVDRALELSKKPVD